MADGGGGRRPPTNAACGICGRFCDGGLRMEDGVESSALESRVVGGGEERSLFDWTEQAIQV